MTRPLVCVRDDRLLDDVLGLAAAAGTTLERAPDADALRTRWRTAPLVLLDTDAARECHEADLRPRDAVLLVAPDPPPPESWRLAMALGSRKVVTLPDGGSDLIDAITESTRPPAVRPGRVVAVVGGRGGAGASTFAAALGLTAVELGHDALLVDCDPLGGGIDLLLGAEREAGPRWPQIQLTSGRIDAAELRSSLPKRVKGHARLSLLSGAQNGVGPSPEAVAAVLAAGRRAGDMVVCDLPRSFDAAAVAAIDAADVVVVVVPAEVRACAAAKQVIDNVVCRGTPVGLVVRKGPGSVLEPDEVAEALGARVLASVRGEVRSGRSIEHGTFRPRGALARGACLVLRELSTMDNPAREPARAGGAS